MLHLQCFKLGHNFCTNENCQRRQLEKCQPARHATLQLVKLICKRIVLMCLKATDKCACSLAHTSQLSAKCLNTTMWQKTANWANSRRLCMLCLCTLKLGLMLTYDKTWSGLTTKRVIFDIINAYVRNVFSGVLRMIRPADKRPDFPGEKIEGTFAAANIGNPTIPGKNITGVYGFSLMEPFGDGSYFLACGALHNQNTQYEKRCWSFSYMWEMLVASDHCVQSAYLIREQTFHQIDVHIPYCNTITYNVMLLLGMDGLYYKTLSSMVTGKASENWCQMGKPTFSAETMKEATIVKKNLGASCCLNTIA